ncbi:riboflavin kinase [Niveomyces insectorum RCEF 264]|uniref:Riboflavin kinase n=1 Tax=Niveomyces insectorum RCEF 264 TaxID=1081102 RepID=A0A167XNW0_9HYPO|nr:riboflavin kinase [Niveomyces insectorum RCEF 264]
MASSARPAIIGPDSGPEAPYPLRMEGPVIRGFGRGSKELGIPTANLPVDPATAPWITDCVSGVYFGWALLEGGTEDGSASSTGTSGGGGGGGASAAAGPPPEPTLYPMVMSIGYNPFYNNKTRTAEVHILHTFASDFYGAYLRLAILGFVRPERGDYPSLDALVADIRFDCAVARRSLARPAWTPAGVPVVAADVDHANADEDGDAPKATAGEGGATGTLQVRGLLPEGPQ